MRALAWLCVVGGLLLAALVLTMAPAPTAAPTAAMEVHFEGRQHRLHPLDGLRLEQRLHAHLEHHQQATEIRVREAIDQHLHAYFTTAHARIPEFADWYYSLSGEYTRLSWAILARTGLAEPEAMAATLDARLFGAEAPEAWLDQLHTSLAGLIAAEHREMHQSWNLSTRQWLQQRREHGSTAPADSVTVDLEAFAVRMIGHESPELILRMTGAGSGAAIGGGALLTRQLMRQAGQRSTAAAAGRAGGRVASRAGGASLGLLACAPTGPVALGCAAAAGLGTWLLADWTLLRLDEHLNRDELEAMLAETLHELEATIGDHLHSRYENAMLTRQTLLRADIERTFVPARRLWGRNHNL